MASCNFLYNTIPRHNEYNTTISIINEELAYSNQTPHYFTTSELDNYNHIDITIANYYLNAKGIKVDLIKSTHQSWLSNYHYVFYRKKTEIKIFCFTIYKSYK